MPDDIDVTPGAGATVATDLVGSRHFQRVKLDVGGDGLSDPVVGALPVSAAELGDIQTAVEAIQAAVDTLESLTGTTNSTLTTIDGRVDGLETLAGTTNSTLSTIDGHVDGIETLLTAIDGHVDGIEGSVDGIEALIGTTNTTLTTIDGRVDGLEALVGTTNSTLTTIDGHVDGIEGTQASIVTAVQKIDDPVLVDDAGFTPASSSVMMAGFQADESSTDSVDEGDAGAARMTLDRKVIVTVEPHTAGGLTTAMFSGSDGSSILTNAAQVIKGSAGQVYGYYIYNPNNAATFVHFYNTAAASVTVGTTNPLFTLTIPAQSAANLMGAVGILFSNAGFSIATTTTAGGNSAPATGLDAVVWYA